MGNTSTKSKKNIIWCDESVWERCYELFIQAENGNNESLKELEEICQNNQNDAVCLGYYFKLMTRFDEFKFQNKFYQTKQQISEIISNLQSNSSSFDSFIENLSNKHQQFVFGYFYDWGIGVRRLEGVYLRLMKLSSDQGHVLADYEMGEYFMKVNGVYENKKFGFQYFMRAATKGYSVAQFRVGDCYEWGRGVKKDLCLAFAWYKKSAENGYPLGCYQVGECYFLGRGTEVNEEEGIKWLQLSIDKGNWEGLLMMGEFYHYGSIVEKDRNKSIQLFEKSAVQRNYDDDANYFLCLHYLQGERDPSNQTKGFQYLNKIKDPNDRVRNLVGLCYEFGLGVEKNQQKAFELFPLAKYNAGRCFEEGIGVKANVVEARRYFERAANGERYEGEIDAQNKLREFKEDKVRVRFRKKQLVVLRK